MYMWYTYIRQLVNLARVVKKARIQPCILDWNSKAKKMNSARYLFKQILKRVGPSAVIQLMSKKEGQTYCMVQIVLDSTWLSVFVWIYYEENVSFGINDDNLLMDVELRCLQSDHINKSKTRQIGIQETINIHHMSWCISNLWIKSHFWISLWDFFWWSTLDMFASWHSITNMRLLLSMPRNHPVKGWSLKSF